MIGFPFKELDFTNASVPYKVPNQSVIFISAYCQQLEDMIAEKIDTFTSLRDKARNFRKCLNDEEAKSRQLMNRNYWAYIRILKQRPANAIRY